MVPDELVTGVGAGRGLGSQLIGTAGARGGPARGQRPGGKTRLDQLVRERTDGGLGEFQRGGAAPSSQLAGVGAAEGL